MSHHIHVPDYLLLDAAQTGQELEDLRATGEANQCLYKGNSGQTLSQYAPYLFLYTPKSSFAETFFHKGWHKAWGVAVIAAQPIEVLTKHFRKFLIVRNEALQELYFRFYDPRVLRIFLPTCDASQLKEFFGPVKKFICADKDAQYSLVFSLKDGLLKTERLSSKSVFTELKNEVKSH